MTRMWFDSANLQGTGAVRKRAGGGRREIIAGAGDNRESRVGAEVIALAFHQSVRVRFPDPASYVD